MTIEALRDHQLPGGSVPVRFDRAAASAASRTTRRGWPLADHPLSRGDSYDVWSYAPSPTPCQLAASKPIYGGPIVEPRDEYREVQSRVYPRLFGKPGRAAYVHYLMTDLRACRQLQPFARLQALAEHVAGGARSPYAAAVALEQWFRFGGGFVYDQHPPKPPAGVAPLEDFVAHTRRGYCQHFAGAMALMLRYLGIPSRVAVGFTSGNYQHGEWVVSDRNAHMWVEVWFRGWGWIPFDPTPSRGGLAGHVLGLVAELRHQRGDGRARRQGGTAALRQHVGEHARLRHQGAHLARRARARHRAGRGGGRQDTPPRLGDPAAPPPRDRRQRSCCSRSRSCSFAARAS